MNRARLPIELTLACGFNQGHTFTWAVDPALCVSGTRVFCVEESNDSEGPWTQISPSLTARYVWGEPQRRVENKDENRNFRVKLTVGSKTYYSNVIMASEPDDKRRVNKIRELLRRELLLARTHQGIEGQLYLKNRDGAKCDTCVDPILGNSTLGDECPVCGGSKLDPPFIGPYTAWLTFTPEKRMTVNSQDGVGKISPSEFSIRVAGTTQLRTADLIVDKGSKRIYYVDGVDVTGEIQRHPVVQQVGANEMPTTDRMYNLAIFND